MKDNPWRGLSPYTEPKEGEVVFPFCGRSKAIGELTSMIHNNLFVTLYGKTGIGKTSLLQAGVFPYLRSRRFSPISIRLGQLSKEDNLAGFVISEIKSSIGEENIQSNCKEQNLLDENCLWLYFSSTMFFDKRGQIIFPVLVFDQFEEIFISRKDDAWFFMRQLYALLDDSLIVNEEKGQHLETNFRIVVSIREDELFRLDDCVDSLNLSEMLSNRYRLAELRDEEAREVVLVPGDGIIKKDEGEKLATQIIQFVKDKNGNQLNTLLLSLICNLLYDAATKEWSNYIGIRHLQALGDNPLKEFYQSVANNFTRKQRDFVEDRLVDINGRRNPIPQNEFERYFGKDRSLFDGEKHIFNTVSVASDNTIARVELVHDLIAQTIHEGKMRRIQKRTLFQRILTYGIFDCFVLSIDLFVISLMVITHDLNYGHAFLLPLVLLLLFSTYMLNVTRINNDLRVEAFVLPQLATTLFIYKCCSMGNSFAYHVIRPSIIDCMTSCFLWLNLLLILLSLYSRIFVMKTDQTITHDRLEWSAFFTFKRKKNRYAQVSLVIGLVISLCVFTFTPKTNIEKIRERVEQGDSNAMVELGNYYLKYIPDYDKAGELFKRAKDLGNNHADERLLALEKENSTSVNELTPEMETDAMRALVASDRFSSLNTIVKFIHGDMGLLEQCDLTNYVIDYLEQVGDCEAIMRWKSYKELKFGGSGVGYEFWRGGYVEQDLVRAFELYVKERSHLNVVICLLNGWGVEKSPQRAREYIKKEQCDNVIPFNVKLMLILL